jgi:hypothetical protein
MENQNSLPDLQKKNFLIQNEKKAEKEKEKIQFKKEKRLNDE